MEREKETVLQVECMLSVLAKFILKLCGVQQHSCERVGRMVILRMLFGLEEAPSFSADLLRPSTSFQSDRERPGLHQTLSARALERCQNPTQMVINF